MINNNFFVLTNSANKKLKLQDKIQIGRLYNVAIPYLEKDAVKGIEEFFEVKHYMIFPEQEEEYFKFKENNEIELLRISSKDIMALYVAKHNDLPVLVFEKVEKEVCEKLGIKTLTLKKMLED